MGITFRHFIYWQEPGIQCTNVETIILREYILDQQTISTFQN